MAVAVGVARHATSVLATTSLANTNTLTSATNQPAPNDRLRFSNEAYQVNAEPGQFESVGGRLMTWIDISSQHPDASKQAWVFDSQQTGRAVNNVRGGSMRVRVVWRDSNRWRKIENTNFLAQPSLR